LVRLMGHSDSKMIRNVYLQIPSRSKRNEAGAAWPTMRTAAPGTGVARISPIRAPRAALTLHSQSIDLTPVMHSIYQVNAKTRHRRIAKCVKSVG